jgi:predicted deacylase
MTEHAARRTTPIRLFTLANGHEVVLHVHEVKGSQSGPTLGLIAGVHGDEPLSIEIVRRVVVETDPATLRGTILAISVANPYAIQALTRNTPLDMSNLNRIFPGDPNGLLSDQIAHAIATEFIPRCTYLIDFHSGGNLATVDYVYLPDDASSAMGKAYSCEILYRGASPPGSTADFAGRKGIPTIISELGGGQANNDHFIAKGVRGVNNVLKHLGMRDGKPELPPKRTLLTELLTLRPHHGGFMYSNMKVAQLGSSVPKGTSLGRILNPYTFEVLEEVKAPFDPSILVLVRESITKVDPGDYGFMVGNAATAQAL